MEASSENNKKSFDQALACLNGNVTVTIKYLYLNFLH